MFSLRIFTGNNYSYIYSSAASAQHHISEGLVFQRFPICLTSITPPVLFHLGLVSRRPLLISHTYFVYYRKLLRIIIVPMMQKISLSHRPAVVFFTVETSVEGLFFFIFLSLFFWIIRDIEIWALEADLEIIRLLFCSTSKCLIRIFKILLNENHKRTLEKDHSKTLSWKWRIFFYFREEIVWRDMVLKCLKYRENEFN